MSEPQGADIAPDPSSEEWLQNAKREAMAYVQARDLKSAVASMGAAMKYRSIHEGRSTDMIDMLIVLGIDRIFEGRAAVEEWIRGFR